MAELTARDLMTTPVVTTSPDATLGEVAETMLQHGISCLPVVDSRGSLVGVITQTDFVPRERHLPFSEESFFSLLGDWVSKKAPANDYRSLAPRPVREVMSRPVVTLDVNATVGEVTQTMYRRNMRRLPVLQEARSWGSSRGTISSSWWRPGSPGTRPAAASEARTRPKPVAPAPRHPEHIEG